MFLLDANLKNNKLGNSSLCIGNNLQIGHMILVRIIIIIIIKSFGSSAISSL